MWAGDVATIGNHEFDYGYVNLAELCRRRRRVPDNRRERHVQRQRPLEAK